jgi:hypothetical protein
MNPKTTPTTQRDGIQVPVDFATSLAVSATNAALKAAARRNRIRRLTLTATAIAAVFTGVVLTLRPPVGPQVAPATELTADEAWTALEQGDVTLTDDELLELAELHGITSL